MFLVPCGLAAPSRRCLSHTFSAFHLQSPQAGQTSLGETPAPQACSHYFISKLLGMCSRC